MIKNDKIQGMSSLSGTTYDRGFDSYVTSTGRTESASSILQEHSSNGVWRITEISSFKTAV